MKILWITNTIIGAMHKKIYGNNSNGLWMDALLNDFIQDGKHDIVVATTGRVDKLQFYRDNTTAYYILPGGFPIEYKLSSSKVNEWRYFLTTEKPDIIHIWGTEFMHALAALKANVNIPTVVYIQGLLESIARYYEAGIPHKDLKKSVTIRDILKRDSLLQQQKKYRMNAKYEEEILRISNNIISENEWCNAHVRARVPNINIYNCPLSINMVFKKYQWNMSNVEPYSIICNASGYPIKGLHILLHALSLVKREYPVVRLAIPGFSLTSQASLRSHLSQRGYSKYIIGLIKQLNLENNVVWLGNLSQEQLAKQYCKSHLFVLSSSIENHSSSLKEAMMIGVPSIASAVGGIPEYVNNGINAFLYRFEEYEMLAEKIKYIFKDENIATSISQNARISMIKRHENSNIYHTMLNIYNEIIGKYI